MIRTLRIALFIAAIFPANSASLTSPQIQEAITYGSQFQTRDKFLDKGLKGNGIRVKLGPGLMGSSISRYVTFFNDWNWIASEAAAARQQLKDVSPTDFHPAGMLHAFLEVHAFGQGAIKQLNRKYLGDRSHLVIRAGNHTIQPINKKMLMLRAEDTFTWDAILLAPSGKITVEFEFEIDAQELNTPVLVILSDGDGKRFEKIADLSDALKM